MSRCKPIALLPGCCCTELQAMCKPCLLSAEQEEEKEEERKQPSERQAVKMADRRIPLFFWKQRLVSPHSLIWNFQKIKSPVLSRLVQKKRAFFFQQNTVYIQPAGTTTAPVPIQINGLENNLCPYIPQTR